MPSRKWKELCPYFYKKKVRQQRKGSGAERSHPLHNRPIRIVLIVKYKYTGGLPIQGFWYLKGVMEPVPHGYQWTTKDYS
jgi:hypothetical protein